VSYIAQADLLAGTRAAFESAWQAAGPDGAHEAAFRFAGHRVRMQVAGSELAAVLHRCFEPLACPGTGDPALSIRAWDRKQTGFGCPGVPDAPDRTDVLGPGLLSQYRGGSVLRYDRSTIVKSYDRARCDLFICVQDARELRLNDRTKPFPHFLATWYLDRGVQLLHAGAVARHGRGILLGGAGGSGKSTCAIACAFGGFDFLGDDTVGVELDGDATVAHACYNAVRCGARNLSWFPQLRSKSTAPTHHSDKGKSLVYMSDVCPGRTVPRTSIAAIVVAGVAGAGASRLAPASKAATLRRIAPSTLLRGLGAGASGFASIAELTRRLPCYEITIGETATDVPDLLDGLLRDLAP